MILLIDNYDSFTYNLAQQIEGLGHDVKVIKNDELTVSEIVALQPQKIVVSPGPGTPDDSGVSIAVIKQLYRSVPILGVCLGHQCIGQLFGARVVHAPKVMHGMTSPVHHTNSGLFKGAPEPLNVARYHSLIVDKLPDDFKLEAWTEDNIIMAMSHRDFPLFGVQFHPESFMTERGNVIMNNFLHV